MSWLKNEISPLWVALVIFVAFFIFDGGIQLVMNSEFDWSFHGLSQYIVLGVVATVIGLVFNRQLARMGDASAHQRLARYSRAILLGILAAIIILQLVAKVYGN